ncbi:hypothetical protein MMC31_005125 [Peltigera leucophlebia]|nr:hypothetical protein [Peltigera leucophlebia]
MSTSAERTVPPSKHTVVIPSKSTIEPTPPCVHLVGLSQNFAKLIPANERTRNAFHQTILYSNEDPTYHKLFVAIDNSLAVDDSSGEYSSNTDTVYETDISCQTLSKGLNLHRYFTLSLKELPLLAETIGWRIGKFLQKHLVIFGVLKSFSSDPARGKPRTWVLSTDSGAFVIVAGSNKIIWFYLDDKEI